MENLEIKGLSYLQKTKFGLLFREFCLLKFLTLLSIVCLCFSVFEEPMKVKIKILRHTRIANKYLPENIVMNKISKNFLEIYIVFYFFGQQDLRQNEIKF